MQSHGQTDMDELAGMVSVNRRNIERRFATSIGMSPKQLSRAVRLQATLRMLEQKNFTSLTSLAYENGYYDQAHFIKDFKEFTGIKPKSFYARNLRLAALFSSEEISISKNGSRPPGKNLAEIAPVFPVGAISMYFVI